MTVGERIRARRQELNLTQEDLANKMGYSGKSTICKAETCGDEITTTKVKKYAKALDCSFEYLMGWKTINNDIVESAMIDAKITNDAELNKAIKQYYSMPTEKQKQVIDFINFLSKGE